MFNSQIQSGDTIVIRGQPRGGPPPEKTISLSNIVAPKLARRGKGPGEETKDEPWAWEAREFLRKKLINQEVVFNEEKTTSGTKIYGSVWLGKGNYNKLKNQFQQLIYYYYYYYY